MASGPQAEGPVLSPGDCSRLRLFVRRRLPHWPGPADLARELGLSPDYFARVFRRSLGLSPRAWLVDERIRCAAASLLENDDPVATVAAAHGYADLTLFGRQFRQVMGSPPRTWREQHRTFSLEDVG
jgi:AraC-like DNA-binding protein